MLMADLYGVGCTILVDLMVKASVIVLCGATSLAPVFSLRKSPKVEVSCVYGTLTLKYKVAAL